MKYWNDFTREAYSARELIDHIGEEEMPSNDRKPLTAGDFPVGADGHKIRKQDGTPIADADCPAVAAEIADRLNEDEAGRDEDRWSA